MLTYQEVREYLPQQFPMILVDKVLDYEKGKTLTAAKNVTGNEIVFLGHFPGFAIMPGALILEGFGQSAAILYQLTLGMMQHDEIPLYGSVKAKFFKTVVPGDQLIYEIEVIKITSRAGLFKAVARVDMDLVARAELGVARRRNAKPEATAIKEEEQEPLILT
jgi:3-hydroxyacyl-[acyl-carrier-protein] dehydratase